MSIIGTITRNVALTVSIKMANFGNVKNHIENKCSEKLALTSTEQLFLSNSTNCVDP